MFGFASALRLEINPVAISAGTSSDIGTVYLSNSTGISFGITNSSLITAKLPSVSYFDYGDIVNTFTAVTTSGSVNLSFQRIFIPNNISATRLDFYGSQSVAGSTNGSYTISVGVYTFNASSASTVSSSSVGVTFTSGNATTASSIYAFHSGAIWRSCPIGTASFTPGEYLVGLMLSANGPANSTGSWTIAGGLTFSISDNFGSGNNSFYFNHGVYSAATGAFPASLHLSDINQTHAAAYLQPAIRLIGSG